MQLLAIAVDSTYSQQLQKVPVFGAKPHSHSPSHLCFLLTFPFSLSCFSVLHSKHCIAQFHMYLKLLSTGSGQRIHLSHKFCFSEHLKSS